MMRATRLGGRGIYFVEAEKGRITYDKERQLLRVESETYVLELKIDPLAVEEDEVSEMLELGDRLVEKIGELAEKLRKEPLPSYAYAEASVDVPGYWDSYLALELVLEVHGQKSEEGAYRAELVQREILADQEVSWHDTLLGSGYLKILNK